MLDNVYNRQQTNNSKKKTKKTTVIDLYNKYKSKTILNVNTGHKSLVQVKTDLSPGKDIHF